jgi:aryl-alcohol dehydrogenase-like predicted oxidoreductase
MKVQLLGRSALEVSEVCLGSMTWGEQNTEADGHAQLDYAISRGINFIDTAEMYAVPVRAETYGATEKIIGTWLQKKGRAFRQQIILATKCAGPSRNASDVTWVRGELKAFSSADIQRGVTNSLKRLQTDYIDLYQLHWPARNVPMFGGQFFDVAAERESVALEETLAALHAEVKAGRIREIGLSNETPWGVMAALHVSREKNLPRPASIQNAYNLINRVYEHGLSEIGFREQIGLLAYSPLAFGHLTGKYLNDKPANARFTRFPQFGPRYGKPNVKPAVAAYAELAASRGLTLTQLALAFCKSRFFVASTIIGATSVDQLKENIDAFAINLDRDTLDAIDALHLRFTNPAP